MSSTLPPHDFAGAAHEPVAPSDDDVQRPRPATLEVDVIAHEPLPRMPHVPDAPEIRALTRWTAARVAVLTVVVLYLGTVLLLPLGALVVEAIRLGIPAIARGITAPAALAALRLTLLLTAIAVVVNGIFGIAAGLVLVRQRFRGLAILDATIDLVLAVSPVMIGLAFLLLVGRNGWLAPALATVDVRVAFAFPGLVFATLFVTLPFTAREVSHVLAEVGNDEEHVAATLGSSPWRTFFRVTLPNIRRGLTLGLTLTAARALGEFGAVLVLGGAIAGRTDTATTFIYGALEERNEAAAFGLALVLALVSMGFLVTLEYLRTRRKRP
ncbi:MAG TPA: sulfate ABC transporter permease subunit [Gemmatimonadaceae bacterium]|nr:sulfate ABC transporter permease subunit [Gemmatimonadaceae bacterium]